MTEAEHIEFTRATWLREAVRHQHNAAYQAAAARAALDAGNHALAAHWQRGAAASFYNADVNRSAAMNLGKPIEPMQPDITIALSDMDAWDEFAAANEEALQDEYGSVAAALRHARDGGLTLGGGAAPLTFVHFEM